MDIREVEDTLTDIQVGSALRLRFREDSPYGAIMLYGLIKRGALEIAPVPFREGAVVTFAEIQEANLYEIGVSKRWSGCTRTYEVLVRKPFFKRTSGEQLEREQFVRNFSRYLESLEVIRRKKHRFLDKLWRSFVRRE